MSVRERGDRAEFVGLHCGMTIDYPARGVAVVKIAGRDIGEFGQSPMQELEEHVLGGEAVELFIDARGAEGATVDVSHDWAQWLSAHRRHFEHVSMLTGSRFIQITADFVRRFTDLDVMQIYSDPAAFDAALTASIARARSVK